jgi:hypothetical protein
MLGVGSSWIPCPSVGSYSYVSTIVQNRNLMLSKESLEEMANILRVVSF